MNLRKISLLILNITLTIIVLGLGVFAWLSQDEIPGDLEGDYDRDLFVSSSGLFDAFMEFNIPGNDAPLNLSSSEFQSNGDLSIRLKIGDLTVIRKDNKDIVEINADIYVKAYNNLNLRFVVLEKYLNSQYETNPNRNLFNIVYHDNIIIEDNYEYVYHDDKIYKDDEYIKVPLIKHLELKNNSSLSDYSDDFLDLIVIINGIQSNRAITWQDEASVFKEEISFTSTYNLNNLIVDRTELSTVNSTLKNIAFKFRRYNNSGKLKNSKGRFDEYIYSNHPRETKDIFYIPAGDYEVIIYGVNQINISIDRYTNPTLITLTYSYDSESWGLEDYIYGITPLFMWENPYTLKSGDLVYYEGVFYKLIQNNWATTPSPSNARYHVLGGEFDGRAYKPGEFVFHNGSYYRAKHETASEPPSNAWEQFGLAFELYEGSKYSNNSLVYETFQDEIKWYIATTRNDNYGQLEYYSGWRELTYDYNSLNSYGKYQEGDIIKYNNHYYIAGDSNFINQTPQNQTNDYYIKSNERGIFDINNKYSRGDIVIHEGAKYIWRNDITYQKEIPNIDFGWHYLSEENGDNEFGWHPLNLYRHSGLIKEHVYYKNEIYLWMGSDNANSEKPPGESREGWRLVSESFSPFNEYKKGEYVIQDGSLWRAKEDIPINPSTGANILPRGIGSFDYWEEVTMVLNPGRN